jgi:hypothetical protein
MTFHKIVPGVAADIVMAMAADHWPWDAFVRFLDYWRQSDDPHTLIARLADSDYDLDHKLCQFLQSYLHQNDS